jgi:hypothetical protein
LQAIKFVDYLKQNSQTAALRESFDFDKLSDSLSQSDLILVGEIHGFHEPQLFDYNLFTYAHSPHNYRYYLAELDLVQAHYLNKYLETGEEKYLNMALQKWGVIQCFENERYSNKYKKLQEYYDQLDSTDKFQFIGVDKLQDKGLVLEYIEGIADIEADESYSWLEINAILGKTKSDTSITSV